MLADKLKLISDNFMKVMPKNDAIKFKSEMNKYINAAKMGVAFVAPSNAGDKVTELLRRIMLDVSNEGKMKKWYGRTGCYWCQPWWWNYWYNSWSPLYWWSWRPYVGASSPRVMTGNSNSSLNPQSMNISCNDNLCTMTLQFLKN